MSNAPARWIAFGRGYGSGPAALPGVAWNVCHGCAVKFPVYCRRPVR